MTYIDKYNICPKCGNKAKCDCGKITSWDTTLRFDEPITPSYVMHGFECECGCAWTTTIYLQATLINKETTNE